MTSASQPAPPTADAIDAVLCSLEGVAHARTVLDGTGVVREVHVLANKNMGAKMLVRNVQSAINARFGLTVDHRVISVAVTKPTDTPAVSASPVPASAPASRALARSVVDLRGQRGYFLDTVEMGHDRVRATSCRVTLRRGASDVFVGEADGRVVEPAVEVMAAHATLAALQRMDPRVSEIRLVGAKTLPAFDHEVVLVCLSLPEGLGRVLVTGSALIAKDRPREIAAATAVLDGTNRWLADRLPSLHQGG